MRSKPDQVLSRWIKFCPKTGRPVKPLKRWILPIFSVLSLIWVIIRVIPKPQRATYPCMKVAIPFAASLVIYLSSLFGSVLAFKTALKHVKENRYRNVALFTLISFGLLFSTVFINIEDTLGSESFNADYQDPLGPNQPIGDAKGIIPGRVVWMHNPDATNESCTPWEYGDGYFMDKNCDQALVDEMLSEAMLEISGTDTEEAAWDAVFKYFNKNHGKGETGYADGETIFIKINAVHAWTTNEDLSIKDDDAYGDVDTSPQVILSVLKQLINKAGVPEKNIYIGDPYTEVFKHLYEKLSEEFPDVNYISKNDHDNRFKLSITNEILLKYSDRGTVLDQENDQFYDCIVEADYLLNIPAMKGHRGGGVTFFAKNHFGSNTRDGASHLHKGIHKGTRDPVRGAYKMYRVFVDLMSWEHLGGKTLIYIGDFLWGTSMEHDPPLKFQSAPFNDDYTSSILVSLDPVAISSVALDIYQEEFQTEDLEAIPPRYLYVRFSAVDDYLHQAASSDWWPEDILYDPEGDGTPISSLGVHEHWNNSSDRQYSRNLGTGEGIELKYIYKKVNSSPKEEHIPESLIVAPNPFSSYTIFRKPENVSSSSVLKIYSPDGKLVNTLDFSGADNLSWDGTDANNVGLPGGTYIYLLVDARNNSRFTGKVLINR